MKLTRTLGMFAALMLTGSAFGAASLEVKAEGKDANVAISYKTTRINSSMCGLVATRVEITRPNRLSVSIPPREDGTLTVEASVDPRRPCLTAFGPHRGSVTLTRGGALPQLPNGTYRLTINGESYGSLVVTKTGVTLVD